MFEAARPGPRDGNVHLRRRRPVPAPSPSATPAAENQPLKEIGRVTTSAMCTGIVMRANSAIGATLRNDQTLTVAIAALRHADLDAHNEIDKERSMREIDKLGADLRNSSGNADSQIKKLREMSKEATDPVRKAELKAFADALGAALFQQKQIGQNLQSMLVIMDGRDAHAAALADFMSTLPENRGLWVNQNRTGYFDTHNYNDIAMRRRHRRRGAHPGVISAAESRAANHIVGAVNGC